MTLNWTTQSTNTDSLAKTVHLLVCPGADDSAIKAGLEAALEKAVSLLDANVGDESRYLLCEWMADTATLTIVVSDEHKTRDAPEVVQCRLEGMAGQPEREQLQFLLRDYLTTCTAFLGWSLLAAFHEGDRSQSRLL